MKTTTALMQFCLRCLDSRLENPLLIDKKKVLIGSHENCDIQIPGQSVSSYHAFICLKDEGLMVKDLYSEMGVYVNGHRVEEAFVSSGDVLTIGQLSFSVECGDDLVPIFNPDEAIHVTQEVDHIQLPSRPGLVYIDGEYCDIEFDETEFKPLVEMPQVEFVGDYVELDDTQEVVDLAFSVKNKKLEIVSYMNGLMMDISYINMKKGDYYLNSKKTSSFEILFHTIGKTKIFNISQDTIRFYPQENVTPSVPWDKINLDGPLFLTLGAEQISLRFVDHSTGWNALPFFYRDRNFYKYASKVFAGVFLPILLLLFVTLPKKEDNKQEVAIVYKLTPDIVAQKPVESQEKSEVKTEEVTSKNENTGHKENEQQPSKVEFAQASSNKKVMAKAQAQAAPTAQLPQTAPVKAYEFKTSVAFNSLVGEGPKVNTEGSASKNAVSDASFKSGSSDKGELVAQADIGVSKFNGQDKKGGGSVSYGSRGLASKSGFDSSYLEPKTVVLGSMDPELLRKILREYIPQFRHCYQQELIGHSEKVKGVIDLNFTISASGKVAKYDIKVKDAQFSTKGVGCMGQVLGLIDFPKPKGGGIVDVKQPLNFFAETEKI